MGDIINSVTKWVKERSTSPMYGTFVFSVIFWNWKFFYVLFWQSEDKLSLPRIEYVQLNFLDTQTWITRLLLFIILPVISTYVIVWWLPIVSNWVHKKHLSFYYVKRSIIDDARLAYEKKHEENLKLISRSKKEQSATNIEIIKNLSQEEKWLIEFEEFRKLKNYDVIMKQIKDSIYNNSGHVMKYRDGIGGYDTAVVPDVLALADSKNVVKLSGEGNSRKIDLTEKGKFFIEKYLEYLNSII